MAAIQWSDVVLVDASLDVVTAGPRALILEFVNETVNVRRLGGESSRKTKTARVFYAAHFAEMWRRKNDPAAQTGDVTAETIAAESQSVSYASLQADASNLQETAHGRAYDMIARAPSRIGFIPR